MFLSELKFPPRSSNPVMAKEGGSKTEDGSSSMKERETTEGTNMMCFNNPNMFHKRITKCEVKSLFFSEGSQRTEQLFLVASL